MNTLLMMPCCCPRCTYSMRVALRCISVMRAPDTHLLSPSCRQACAPVSEPHARQNHSIRRQLSDLDCARSRKWITRYWGPIIGRLKRQSLRTLLVLNERPRAATVQALDASRVGSVSMPEDDSRRRLSICRRTVGRTN